VEEVRAQGWARAVGEREEDLSAVAAPVYGARGELAGVLGVQGPSSRLAPAALAAAAAAVVTEAARLSAALGGDGEGSRRAPPVA